MEETNLLLLEIVTPYTHFFEGKVESVALTALDGEVGLYPGHEPVVIALTPGSSRIRIKGKTRYAVIMEGYAEVGPYLILVVCNAANWVEDIDVKRARDAHARAVSRLRDPDISPQEKIYARHSVRRAKVRLKLVAEHGSDKQKEDLSDFFCS